jgi:hypothetical protein
MPRAGQRCKVIQVIVGLNRPRSTAAARDGQIAVGPLGCVNEIPLADREGVAARAEIVPHDVIPGRARNARSAAIRVSVVRAVPSGVSSGHTSVTVPVKIAFA